MNLTSFVLKCVPQSTEDVKFRPNIAEKCRHVSISLKGDSANPPLRVEVWFSAQAYKRKESSCHYTLEDLGVHIFLLGMVYLNQDQRGRLAGKFSADSIDEDLIPVLFRQGGMAELQRLHGEFNLVIIDALANDIRCLSSRFGLLPLYYSVNNGSLFVSDSLKMLGEVTSCCELDLAVVAQLCLYNYSLTNNSLLKDCYCLPAGSCLCYIQGKTELKRYWTPEYLLDKELITGEAAVDLIDEAFAGAIDLYASQVDNTALSLTGGWDGRLVLAYMLEKMVPDQIQLYSFGTPDSQDVVIPQKIANAMSLKYQPYFLDQDYLERSFIEAAGNTALCSDGYRSVQRAHYLYAMQDLAKSYSSLASGICGSNVMKAAATTPSVVMNSRVLQILSSEEPERLLQKHLDELKQLFSHEFEALDPDAWAESVLGSELRNSLSQKTYSHKVSCFVFGVMERKYFGPELASYKHLMGNYSPFIDIGFIDALSRTEYFNAYRASGGIFGNRSNAVLYAKLIWRHNSRLAGFPSDKYVKLTDLLHPAKYPLVAAKQVYRRLIRRYLKPVNPYNTDDTLQRFMAVNPGLWGREIMAVKDKNMLGAFVTATYWHYQSFPPTQNSRHLA